MQQIALYAPAALHALLAGSATPLLPQQAMCSASAHLQPCVALLVVTDRGLGALECILAAVYAVRGPVHDAEATSPNLLHLLELRAESVDTGKYIRASAISQLSCHSQWALDKSHMARAACTLLRLLLLFASAAHSACTACELPHTNPLRQVPSTK